VEPVARLLAEVAATGLPYSLQVRPGDAAVAAYAEGRGMAESERAPLMLLTEPPPAAEGVAIRRLGSDGMDTHLDLMARGFGMPPEVLAPLRGSALFDDPAMLAYVAEEDGVAVSTAVGVLARGHVGIFNVATPEEHRRRGYGAALTARVVRDGFDAGATTALLQSSDMGYSVYERLGFREAERWTVWVSEQPA
jgi:GNAT superfamily N-acetyltransferase